VEHPDLGKRNSPSSEQPAQPKRNWFAAHDLPEELIPYPATGLKAYLAGDTGVTMHGWPAPEPAL
jgi:hypothetical protein